jgi:hypothetical protein
MAQSPYLFPCPACGGQVASTAASCPHCGYRPVTAVTGPNWSALGLALAGLCSAIGSFLPWVTASSFISVSRNGIDGGGDGVFTLAIGGFLVILAIINFDGRGLGTPIRILSFLAGVAALAIVFVDGRDVARIATGSQYLTVSIGIGLIVVGIAGGIAVVTAALAPRRTGIQ